MAEALVEHMDATYALDAFPIPTHWTIEERVNTIVNQGDWAVKMTLSGKGRRRKQVCSSGAIRLLENDQAFKFYWKRHVSLRVLKELEESQCGTMESAVALLWGEYAAAGLRQTLHELSPLEEYARVELLTECEICMEDVTECYRSLHENPQCNGHGLVCGRCLATLDHDVCYVCSEPIFGFQKIKTHENQYCRCSNY